MTVGTRTRKSSKAQSKLLFFVLFSKPRHRMIDSVWASQAFIGICSARTFVTTGLSRQCRKTISCDKAVDSKPVQNVVLFTFASPGPNARPVTVEPNLILFGSAVALQLKIALLKTQERLLTTVKLCSVQVFRHSTTRTASGLESKSKLVTSRTTSTRNLKTIDYGCLEFAWINEAVAWREYFS